MWSARTSAVAQLTRGVGCITSITRRALKSWSWSSLYRFKGLDGLMVFFLSSRSAHGGGLRDDVRLRDGRLRKLELQVVDVTHGEERARRTSD